MRRFPTTEGDLMDLTQLMISGVTTHPEDFPGIDAAALQAQLQSLRQADAAQQSAAALAKNATLAKNAALEQLTLSVRAAVKRAEADCSAAPVRLAEIGWRPRRQGGKLLPPAPALELQAARCGDTGAAELSWRKGPGGGPVRCWLVQRRSITPTGPAPWTLAEIAYDTLVVLPDPHPNHHGQVSELMNLVPEQAAQTPDQRQADRGVKWGYAPGRTEYRVIASNAAGNALPSNVVTIL